MMSELDNPFSVTKATEFSDGEINEYWVNFNAKENVTFDTFLNPTEFLPKYVIGGKGCGKTHILRYFSFPVQKIRNQNDVTRILSIDKYVGLYSIFGGLNSSRFDGKGVSNYEWQTVFEYYFELYICDNLLETIQELVIALNTKPDVEKKLAQTLTSLFSNSKELANVTTFNGIVEILSNLRWKIDSQVLNAAFTRKLEYEDVKVLFAPGDLIFGIPQAISTCIPEFKDVKFIYIFDEYEKLFEWQKKFVNTLVWDKKTPVTFWIGARRYGYTTRETKSGQEMKSGSEFQDINLDVIIRSNADLYQQFAEKLYSNRLVKFYETRGLKVNTKEVSKTFCEKFEKYSEERILSEVILSNKKKEYKHLKEFRKKIALAIRGGFSLELKDENEIDSLVQQIVDGTDSNPLEQKYKLFYFYQLWYRSKGSGTFKKMLAKINEEYKKSKEGAASSFDEIRDKRKKDLIAQLTKENEVKNTEHSGVDKFIEISEGNARSFILILKKVIEFSKIRGERPLEVGGSISLDSQFLAVYDTAKWFYEDAEVVGETGKQMYNALKNLTDYMMQERFCDKPVETTASCFYVKTEDLSGKASSCIDLMKMHSFIIEDDDGRLEKNSGRKERLFQLNRILAPLWHLPTVIRGSISLNREIAEAIFNPDAQGRFETLYKMRKGQLNAPDFLKSKNGDGSNPLWHTD